jgi:hypothetical protein
MKTTKEDEMVERMDDVPPGVIGLRASGKLTKEDYTEVLEPALKEAFTREEVRLLCEIEPGFEGLEAGALAEDLKTAFRLMIGEERHRWKRVAIVTDIDWIRRATEAFAWIVPGEIKVFLLAERDDARAWVAG